MAAVVPSYIITEPLTASGIVGYANTYNKPRDQAPTMQPNTIDIVACATQNVSDSVHDGLKEKAAQSALPDMTPIPVSQDEDTHLSTFLYNLNRQNPSETIMSDHMKSNYVSYFRIPLFNGENSNVDANGNPIYGNRDSVIESILDEIGVSSSNIFLSYDFGFKAEKYDFAYFKSRQVYVGYRPCQENDAAGKPKLSSSNANDFGLRSSQIPVEFLWTNLGVEFFPTYLPKHFGRTDTHNYVNGIPASENYTVSRFDTYSGWDKTITNNKPSEPDILKSQTIFHDPLTNELLLSNSEWTSKAEKDQKKYEKFLNELVSIKDKNPLALLSIRNIIGGHKLQSHQFDIFHALAKNSGDKHTAIVYPNSYTPDMLASVMAVLNMIPAGDNESSISIKLLEDPVYAGEMADAISAAVFASPDTLYPRIASAIKNGSIKDIISNTSTETPLANRAELRKKPRLVKKLTDKSGDISSIANYTYMWLVDYMFVYVTHDRLAFACAAERLVDCAILVSPRSNDESVFSIIVRQDKIDKTKTIEIKKNDMLAKINKLQPIEEISVSTGESMPILMQRFDIPAQQSQYLSIFDIQDKITQVMSAVTRKYTAVSFVSARMEVNDEILRKNIIYGLVMNTYSELLQSSQTFYTLFSNVIAKLVSSLALDTSQYTVEYFIRLPSATHTEFITTTILPRLIDLAQIPLEEITPEQIASANTLFYQAKEYLQLYNAFQSLHSGLLDLSGDITDSDLLVKISGTSENLRQLLNQSTQSQILALKPVTYINTTAAAHTSARLPKDWFTSSKTILKRVISNSLPTDFGLTQLFIKLIPMIHSTHVNNIVGYFRSIFIPWISRQTKTELKIVFNCLTAIFSADITDVAKFLEKLEEYDKLFTHITSEEKTLLKELEKAGRTVTKCLSKKKQLEKDTKEAELAAVIKDTIAMLIPRQGMFGGKTLRKTMYKYKSQKSGKKTRKSGGAGPVISVSKGSLTPAGRINDKNRIKFFYICITGYILYLTNVIDLYSNEQTSQISELKVIIENVIIVRDMLVEITHSLSTIYGGNITHLFAGDNIDKVQYIINKCDMGQNRNFMELYENISDPNEYQLFVSLSDSFNLHLVNIGTYLSNLENMPDIDGRADLKDELMELLDDIHDEISMYVFLNDIYTPENALSYQADPDTYYTSIKNTIAPRDGLSCNYGLNHSLLYLLERSKYYCYNGFQNSPNTPYNFEWIKRKIRDDFITYPSMELVLYVPDILAYSIDSINRDDLNMGVLNSISASFKPIPADVNSLYSRSEVAPPYSMNMGVLEEPTIEESGIAYKVDDDVANESEEILVPWSEIANVQSTKDRPVKRGRDNNALKESSNHIKRPVYAWGNSPPYPMGDSNKSFSRNRRPYSSRMGYEKKGFENNRHSWGGSNSNKTLKLNKKINRITRKKKLPHVRKTRKNTKRPKYIKKNATRRRR